MGKIKKASKSVYAEAARLKEEQEKLQEKIAEKEKREIYIKAQNVIKNARIEKYMKDREVVSREGLTVLGIFSGRNSLQIQRLENIKLKIELLQTQKIDEKNSYEPTDTLADLYSCAISELNGKFNKEMKIVYNEIKNKYPDEIISDEEIYKLVCDKVEKGQNYLPVIHKEKSKGIFGDIKVQIDFLQIENKKLKNQIVIERGRSQFETFKHKIVPLGIV